MAGPGLRQGGRKASAGGGEHLGTVHSGPREIPTGDQDTAGAWCGGEFLKTC